jgi:sirohydrochlorin cobaltochelatase
MALEIEQALESWCAGGPQCIGQILIERSTDDSFVLCHRDDAGRDGLKVSCIAGDAAEIAKFEDAGKYRPLKTAPNLAHGWRMELATLRELRHAFDLFYPGRLATFLAYRKKELVITPLRETLNRQSGMYRVAAKISDDEIDEVVGNFCRSDGGCLRAILWKRDESGAIASTKLPPEKFDSAIDQAAGLGSTTPATTVIPLLCQEACNLLVKECRKIVKMEEGVAPSEP